MRRRSEDESPYVNPPRLMRSRNRSVSRLVLAPALLIALTTACLAPPARIDGTNYPASAPPFIAPGTAQTQADAALPEQPGLIHRIALIGDGGVPMESEPVLASLGLWANVDPDATTVLFLGDNVYPAGIEEDKIAEGEEVLRKQLASTTAARVFIPGNHDWGRPGSERVLRQQAYVDVSGGEFIPRDGCPGPTLRPIVPAGADGTRGISVIVFDIDPWYFGTETVKDCADNTTPEALAEDLAQLLSDHRDEWLIVAAHHPMRTGGPHGGFSRGAVGDFATGLIYMIFGTLQDTTEEQYQTIMAPIQAALETAPPLLYAAGHDHNLQVLDGGDHAAYEIVSGAGATTRVRDGHVTDIDGTLFAHGHPGFMVVDFIRTAEGERVLLHVVETEHDAPVFSMEIGTR